MSSRALVIAALLFAVVATGPSVDALPAPKIAKIGLIGLTLPRSLLERADQVIQ